VHFTAWPWSAFKKEPQVPQISRIEGNLLYGKELQRYVIPVKKQESKYFNLVFAIQIG